MRERLIERAKRLRVEGNNVHASQPDTDTQTSLKVHVHVHVHVRIKVPYIAGDLAIIIFASLPTKGVSWE